MEEFLIYTGKVRKIYKVGENHLLMRATNRVSSFDKHIGTIPGKGELLNKMSAFWFNKTSHIIENHLIASEKDIALVHRCKPFAIEVVVRGYITGNTSTSLWTHYNKGERVYCGIEFPDGLKKHQKLDAPIITPTTKGETVDIPISRENIISERYMTEEECDFIFEKALELFSFGQKIADRAGLILVDTKYEFGRDKDGRILLIDEVHTCDSSRFWIQSSFSERIANDLEPEKLDKDCIRDWVKSMCDPYKDKIPIVPDAIIKKAYSCYKQFYDMISMAGEPPIHMELPDKLVSSNKIINTPLVVILYGSISNKAFVESIEKALSNKALEYESYMASAHKNTEEVLYIIKKYDNQSDQSRRKIIWVTVAGRSNALSGVVAANSRYPVIACPPFDDKMDMMVNIHSSLQCPSGVPVMTILEPGNVALATQKIFNL